MQQKTASLVSRLAAVIPEVLQHLVPSDDPDEFVAGAAAREVLKLVYDGCSACVRALTVDESESQFTKAAREVGHQSYVQQMDRGGLHYPSLAVLQILVIVRSLFDHYQRNVKAPDHPWSEFHHCGRHRAVMLELCDRACESAQDAALLWQLTGLSNDQQSYGDVCNLTVDCPDCKKSRRALFDRVILYFVNLMLSKLAKEKNDALEEKKREKAKALAKAKAEKSSQVASTPLRSNAAGPAASSDSDPRLDGNTKQKSRKLATLQSHQ